VLIIQQARVLVKDILKRWQVVVGLKEGGVEVRGQILEILFQNQW
jgi:hypothetical protein